MGSLFQTINPTHHHVWTWERRKSQGPAVQVSSSLLGVSTVSSARVTMLPVWELVPQYTWLLSWSTWLLRSLSWLVTLLVTTRRPGSFLVTFSWLFAMTRS